MFQTAPQPSSPSFDAIKETLRKSLSDALYRSWIEPLHMEAFTQGILTLSAPTRFIRDWAKNRYQDQIASLLSAAGTPCRDIIWVIASGAEKPVARALAVDSPANQNLSEIITAAVPGNDYASPLDARYTFDSFVEGASNKLAFAAVQRIANTLDSSFGPLFIHGQAGLGKTHLLQATATKLKAQFPQKKIAYMSAEKFMYGFVRALQKRETVAFKDFFRSIDVLLIDDIQFICGKESTQQEFFHTFNSLTDSGKIVILSCDRTPAMLNDIDERLRSRLGMGLAVEVTPADEELRYKILEKKCERFGKKIPADVLHLLAQKMTRSVRELEGALNRLIAQSELLGQDITLKVAEDSLQDILRNVDRRVSVDEIQKSVASFYELKLAELLSEKRDRRLARPRQVAMFLTKELTSCSLPDIGRRFGGRDHTTVLHAIRKIESVKADDLVLAQDIAKIRQLLLSA
jgi:chromosomal replication initiator protein